MCSMFVPKCKVGVCVCVSKPLIRQIMIHHDNGALMAAVKIIFNKPSLCLSLNHTHTHTYASHPLPLVYLQTSHNPRCHSLNDCLACNIHVHLQLHRGVHLSYQGKQQYRAHTHIDCTTPLPALKLPHTLTAFTQILVYGHIF